MLSPQLTDRPGRLIAVFCSVGLLAGCTTVTKYVDRPVNVYGVSASTANNPNPQLCPCAGGAPISIVNNDPDASRAVEWEISYSWRDPNHPGEPPASKSFFDILGPQRNKFAVCSIVESHLTPACQFDTKVAILREQKLQVARSQTMANFGPAFTPNIATCIASCQAHEEPCLDMGHKASGLVQPFQELIAAAERAQKYARFVLPILRLGELHLHLWPASIWSCSSPRRYLPRGQRMSPLWELPLRLV
jgi:hypothetical protein